MASLTTKTTETAAGTSSAMAPSNSAAPTEEELLKCLNEMGFGIPSGHLTTLKRVIAALSAELAENGGEDEPANFRRHSSFGSPLSVDGGRLLWNGGDGGVQSDGELDQFYERERRLPMTKGLPHTQSDSVIFDTARRTRINANPRREQYTPDLEHRPMNEEEFFLSHSVEDNEISDRMIRAISWGQRYHQHMIQVLTDYDDEIDKLSSDNDEWERKLRNRPFTVTSGARAPLSDSTPLIDVPALVDLTDGTAQLEARIRRCQAEAKNRSDEQRRVLQDANRLNRPAREKPCGILPSAPTWRQGMTQLEKKTNRDPIAEPPIRPVVLPAAGSAPFKHDPVERYQMFVREWCRHPPPGDKKRLSLRWRVREYMMRQDIPRLERRADVEDFVQSQEWND